MDGRQSTSGLNEECLEIRDLADSCRLCMARNTAMSCIFKQKSNDIVNKVQYCTGILLTEEDGLPSLICSNCLTNLAIAHTFKRSCVLSDETFRRLIQKQIKTEVVDFHVKLDDSFHVKTDNDFDGKSDDDYFGDVKVEEVEVDDVKPDLKKAVKPIPRKKRGPYNKSGTKRLKKLKYSRLRCEPCGIRFERKEDSDQHNRENHKDCDVFICEICGKVFEHRSSHYTHIKSHLPPEHACDTCDYKTWNKHDLVKHIRIHTGVKMYQCEFCTQSYYTSSNLNSHIRRNHDGHKRYACTRCDKKFFDKTKLNRHIDSHNEVRRFKCDVCQSAFSRRCYWKKHLHTQHNILIPPQRPGRQKTNLLVGELLISQAENKAPV